jgi:hypothetical protein
MEITTGNVIIFIIAFILGSFTAWFLFTKLHLYSRTMRKILKDAKHGLEYKLWKARKKQKSKVWINLLEESLILVEELEKKISHFDMIDKAAIDWHQLPKFKKKIFKKHHNI